MDAAERSGGAEVLALRSPAPVQGTVLLDARGPDRALRVSWHDEDGLVVLSLWRGERCTATFRLEAEDVPTLVDALVTGLGATASSRASARRVSGGPHAPRAPRPPAGDRLRRAP